MNILLTGSNGFVGSNFIGMGSSQDYFRFVYRNSSQVDPQLKCMDNITPFVLNSGVNAETDWGNALDNIDTVIHLAGLAHGRSSHPEDYYDINTSGTLRLAEKACESGVKRFVHVSSIGVLGNTSLDVPFNAKSSPNPKNDYAASKYKAELGLLKISQETKLEVVIVRPVLVYGINAPGNFGSLLKLIRVTPILPFGLASNYRNFISVQNLVDLLIVCAKHPEAAGHTFLASDDEPVSIREFSSAIAAGLGKKIFQLPIPIGMMRFLGQLIGKSNMVEQLFSNLQVDSSQLKEVLGWTPPLTTRQAMKTLRYKDKK